MAGENVSRNIDAYVADPTTYYLGYSDADHKKPFAKYFDFHVGPISDELQKGVVSSPWGSGLGFEASEAHDYLLRPGYLPVENGYLKTPQGAWMVTCRTDMGQGRLGKSIRPLVSHIIHQIRRKADGTREMRSRFWLGPGIPESIAHDICVHCGTEMPHLAKILPQLFNEFKDDL